MTDIIELFKAISREPGVGEVRLCYFASSKTFHARAMPGADEAYHRTVAGFKQSGAESVSLDAFVEATAAAREKQMHHGQGKTPEAALDALFKEFAL